MPSFAWETEPNLFDGAFSCFTPTSAYYYGSISRGQWSPTLGLIAVGGASCDFATSIETSPGDGVWTGRGNPFDETKLGTVSDLIWAGYLAKFIACGFNNDGSIVLAESSDGITWTPDAFTGLNIFGLAASNDLGQVIALGTSVGGSYLTSPDGAAWTTRSYPGNVFGTAAWGSGLWVAGTSGSSVIYTSPDGIAWTARTTPFDGGYVADLAWVPSMSLFVATGISFPSFDFTGMTSPDGVAWTEFPVLPPWDNIGNGIVDLGGSALIGGFDSTTGRRFHLTSDFTTWVEQDTPLDGGSVELGLAYAASIDKVYGFGANTSPDATIVSATPELPPPPPPRIQFAPQVHARLLVTDLDSKTTTWLDKVHLGATFTASLNAPATAEVPIRSNDRQVNTVYSDFTPLVAQSNRLLYILFREGGTGGAWDHCRFAGIIMSPQDQADADVPTTHIVAYDAWQYCMGRPCFINTSGGQIGPDGFLFPATRGGEIVATLLKNTILSEAVGVFIDAGPSYGGTFQWNGVIEETPIIDWTLQQGMSLGQAWNELLTAGQDPDGGPGGVDIILTPIYDPINRPGYTHELSVYNLAGEERPSAPMAWGGFVRTSPSADRQHDGTPGAFINTAAYYVGQAGPLAGLAPVENPASIAAFGPYWEQKWFPDQVSAIAVEAMAQQALGLQKQGKRTFTVAPDPMRAARPFQGYTIGDRVPVIAPRELRVTATGYQRIQTIQIQIGPDGVVRVPQLETTPDWRGDDGT